MKTRLLTLTIGLSLALISCNRPRKAAPAKIVPPLPVVAVEEVPAPAVTTVTVARGETLETLAERIYQHRSFGGFLGRVNEVADPGRLATGTVLRTPALPVAFRDAGLDPRYQPAINALAKATTDFHAVLPAYRKAREASGAGKGSFAIPPEIRDTLLKCADTIEAGADALGHPAPAHHAPKLTVRQFLGAAELLRQLAGGSIDGDGYDYDMIDQRLALGFTYALIWTQQKHQ